MNTLSNKTIVITRSTHQSDNISQLLQSQQANVLELPLINISSQYSKETAHDVFAEMGTYEWILFTSANGVHFFFELFFKAFSDIRCLGPMNIGCIGEATIQALKKYYLKADLVPEVATSESLAKALLEYQSLDNTKILIITGNLNNPSLAQSLETEGRAIVDSFQVYKTEFNDIATHPNTILFKEQGAHAILFTSPSTVQSFIHQAKNLQISPTATKPIAGSIGPSTSEAIKKGGLSVAFEASPHNTEGLISSLKQYFNK